MSEVSITIPSKGTLSHCVERMLVYCALNAYQRYDLAGAKLNEICGDSIHEKHVHCVNAMNARSPLKAWASLMLELDLIGSLPTDKHLLEMSEDEWSKLRPKVCAAIDRMTSVTGIGLASATKMLALKRPELVSACDAQLVTYFGVSASPHVAAAMALMERFRVIAAHTDNLDALATIKGELAACTMFGQPVCLSTTRILEALCWMEATEGGYSDLWAALAWD